MLLQKKELILLAMFEYTCDNHFDYETLKHGTIKRDLMPWREECKHVAQQLYDKHGNDLVVMLSGGVDSEIVLLSFLACGITPRVAMLRYENSLNSHDLSYAYQRCASKEIIPEIIDVNVNEFFKDSLVGFAIKTKITSPQINLHAHCFDRVDGIPVIGAGENFLVQELDRKVYDQEDEYLLRYCRYFIDKQRECIPTFFQYTPEVILSFLVKSSVQEWVKKPTGRTTHKSKIKFVSEDFDVSIRSKLTGFECMMSQDKVYRDKLKSFNFGDSINYQTEYSKYVNKLSGGLYG